MVNFIIFALVAALVIWFFAKNKESETINKIKKAIRKTFDEICYRLRIKPRPEPEQTTTSTPIKTHCPDVLMMDVFDIKETDTGESELVTVYSQKIELKENEICCICREGEKTKDDENTELIYLQEHITPQWSTVSRRHLYITKLPEGYAMQDNYSSFKTFIYEESGEKKLLPHKEGRMIHDKMILSLGAQLIGFKIILPTEIKNIKYPTGPSASATDASPKVNFRYPDSPSPEEAPEEPVKSSKAPRKMFDISFR